METNEWIHMGVAITTQVYLCLSSSVNGLSSHFVVTVTHLFSKEPTTPFTEIQLSLPVYLGINQNKLSKLNITQTKKVKTRSFQ